MTELEKFNLMLQGGYNPMGGAITTNQMEDFKTAALFNQIQDTNNLISSLNIPNNPNPVPSTADEDLLKRQKRGNMLIAFGDLLRGKDATAGFTQRQAMFDAERERAERKAKQEQLLASMNPEQRRIYETYGPQAAYDYEFNKPERKIVEGADGFKYYLDGSRVLPNIGIKKDKGDVFKAENDLRDEHQKLSGTFIDVRDAYGRILSNAEKQTAASDLSLIFNYMKMLDPGSVVREGEFANAQNSAGVPDRIRSRYNNVLKGERLAENTRKDFIETAQRLYQTQLSGQTLLDKNYENLSNTYGLNPKNVVLNFTSEIANKEFGYNLSIMSNDQLATLDEKNYNEDQIELIKKELEKRLK